MKNFMLSAIVFLAFCFQLNAQNTSKEEASLLIMWDTIWEAYESGNEAKVWSFYAENACEIYPDGSSICGLKAIIEGYEQFKTMVEGTPSWSMTKPAITFLGPDVALLMSDVTADVKLKGGQQIGGKSKFAAIVQKVKGNWMIVFDSQTPMIEMPVADK